jgi:hypothetical protein
MKTKRMKWVTMAGVLLTGLLMTGSSLLAETHFSIGIGVGAPGYYGPPPPVALAYRPPYPGQGYYWVDGYYDPYGSWFAGYWAAPRYVRPYGYGYGYVAPRSYGGYYRRYDRDDYRGRDWDHDRGRGRDRDHDGDHDRGRGYGNGYRR